MAMIKVDKSVNQGFLTSHVQLIMHLHDELIFEVLEFLCFCILYASIFTNKTDDQYFHCYYIVIDVEITIYYLIFQVNNSFLDEACSTIIKTMESAVNLCVPLPVKLRKGSSWGDLK